MGLLWSTLVNSWRGVQERSSQLCGCPVHPNSRSSRPSVTSLCRSCLCVVVGILYLPVGCFCAICRLFRCCRQRLNKDSRAKKRDEYVDYSSVKPTSESFKFISPESQEQKKGGGYADHSSSDQESQENEKADHAPVAPEIKKEKVIPDISNYKNYLFFMNRLISKPNGDFIDKIHELWWNDYKLLERHHGFIQWLFPLPEPGVNSMAHVLHPLEIDMIKAAPEAQERLLKSLKMMLAFYGFELNDGHTVEIKRAHNYIERFNNLSRNGHNNLRISRILRCIGLLGLERLQYPVIEAFLREIVQEGTLTGCKYSCFNFWLQTLTDSDAERAFMYAEELEEMNIVNRKHQEDTVLKLNMEATSHRPGDNEKSMVVLVKPELTSSSADKTNIEHFHGDSLAGDLKLSGAIKTVQGSGGNEQVVDKKAPEPEHSSADDNEQVVDTKAAEPEHSSAGDNEQLVDTKAAESEHSRAQCNEQVVDTKAAEPEHSRAQCIEQVVDTKAAEPEHSRAQCIEQVVDTKAAEPEHSRAQCNEQPVDMEVNELTLSEECVMETD